LEAQGRARHLEGDYAGATDAYERAHAAYLRDGDALAAARSARTVGWFRGWIYGDWAVYRGWAGRARSLLRQATPTGREEGWILLDTAHVGNDLENQRLQYEAVITLARRYSDGDLECEARSSLGMMLVFSGLVDEGMCYLDEALAALCAGDVEELPVLEGCLCGLFNACERTHDVSRAEQWLRAAEDLISRRKLMAVAGYCRAHYAGILIAAGRWAEAEAELASAIRSLPDGLAIQANALCRLAALRIGQGRFEEAAALLAGLEDHDDAVRPLTALHLASGHPELALEVLDRVLSSSPFDDHVEAPLLALVVEAHLALSDLGAAGEANERLTEFARNQSSSYVKAIAAEARARLCRASGEGDLRSCMHQAMSLFAEARMPFELARARFELARALAIDRPQVAVAEATAALGTFQQLEAAHDIDAAAALLRTLGAPARAGPKGRERLTRREQEVLALLAHALSNEEIAERLFISARPSSTTSGASCRSADCGAERRPPSTRCARGNKARHRGFPRCSSEQTGRRSLHDSDRHGRGCDSQRRDGGGMGWRGGRRMDGER